MQKWLIYLILVLSLSACSIPSDPGIPTWDTTLQFYIINDSYDLLELAEEDSAIVLMKTAEGDTVLGIYQEEYEEEEMDVGATDGVTNEEYAEIGDIAIPDVGTIDGKITFQEFADANVSGVTFGAQDDSVDFIPSFEFGSVRHDLDPIEEIETVTIMEGSCTISLENKLIVILGNYLDPNPEGGPLKIRLVHIDGSTIDDVIEIELSDQNLGLGDTYEETVPLAGVKIYNNMSLLLTGGSLGTAGLPTTIDYTSELLTTIEFSDSLTASSVNSMIAEQTIRDSVSLEFDDDYELTFAELVNEPGYGLDLHIENQIDVELTVTVSIPSLYMDGIDSPSYEEEFIIPRSGGNGQISIIESYIELSGAELQNADSTVIETIDIIADARVDSTEEGDYRLIEYTESYFVQAELSGLEFERIRGIIQPQEQDPLEESIDLDITYPEIEDGAQFSFVGESSLTFDVDLGESQIVGELAIDVRGYDQFDVETQLIDFDTDLPPVILIPNQSQFQIVFDNDNYSLNELLSILPQSIEMIVNVTAGDGESEVIYHRGDVIGVNITLESTLSLASEAWIIPIEDGETNISEEDIELEQEQYDAFVSAEILLTYKNTTGASVQGEILLSDSKAKVEGQLRNYDNTNLNLVDVITIPELMETSGTDSLQMSIDIAQEDLSYLLKDMTYVGSRLRLVSTGDQPLAGEVQMSAKVILTVHISNDLIAGEED